MILHRTRYWLHGLSLSSRVQRLAGIRVAVEFREECVSILVGRNRLRKVLERMLQHRQWI